MRHLLPCFFAAPDNSRDWLFRLAANRGALLDLATYTERLREVPLISHSRLPVKYFCGSVGHCGLQQSSNESKNLLLEILLVVLGGSHSYKIDYIGDFCAPKSPRKLLKINGRGERIRTSDPLVPNQVRYQTALRPEPLVVNISFD